MKKSAYYSDVFFVFLATAVGLLCILRYLRVGLVLACAAGVLAGVGAAGVAAIVLKNKRDVRLQKANDERLKEKFLLHLILLNEGQRNEYLCSVFDCFERDGLLVKSTGEVLLPIFVLREVVADDILPILRQQSVGEKQICCDKISADGKKFCEQNDVNVLDGVALFSLAKEKNALPQTYASERLFSQKKKERWKVCFSKNNSRRFFSGGIFILLSSLITPFPYYYLIVGFLLLGIAAFTKIFGQN